LASRASNLKLFMLKLIKHEIIYLYAFAI
jgi:hypothetical protein